MDESIKLKLLHGLPVDIGICKIHSLTLSDIVNIGWYEYNIGLANLISEPKDYNINSDIDIDKFTTWDIIHNNMEFGSEECKNLILNTLELFIKESVYFYNDVFYIGKIDENRILDNSNYKQLKNILKMSNCIIEKKEEKIIFANDKAREIQEKIDKYKNLYDKKSNVTMYDLVSIHAANSSSLNIMNIWNLTYFQFNNQFLVTQNIEDYHTNVRALLAGAKSSDIDLKHYVRPVDV